MDKKQNLITIYFGLISLVSFIGLAIAAIVFSNTLISKTLISDEEYIVKNSREISRCDEPIYLVEKEECITKAKENLLLQRSIYAKETLILSWIWTIILLFIFPIHFTQFRKNKKQ